MFATFPRQCNFFGNVLGLHRGLGDHQDDGLARVYRVDDLLAPALRSVNAAKIDPRRDTRGAQPMHELHDPVAVMAGVADHYIRDSGPGSDAGLIHF